MDENEEKTIWNLDLHGRAEWGIARDIVHELACYWAREIIREKQKKAPDETRIAILEAEAGRLIKEHNMGWDDKELIAKARYLYAPIYRSLMGTAVIEGVDAGLADWKAGRLMSHNQAMDELDRRIEKRKLRNL